MNTAAPLAPNASEIVAKSFDGEVIIINLVTGAYYSLAGVGATIWQAIENRLPGREILATVSAHYDVEPATATADLERFIAELRAENIVVESEGEPLSTPPTAAANGPRVPYASPTLNAYRDMRDLLALDPPMPVLGEPADWDTPQDR